ncbi:MAG: ABC transporter ATP-binding protein [Spirochaetaceae bacterium]|jgi:ABC-type nitrate/sulfonate/bicarbonate transport system ATPase subunit|nr:ABC transporter ATP-binding protein [Spirochaetaceae bacterium]
MTKGLRLRGLTKTYHPPGKTVRALDGFSLDIAEGSFTAILGRSGCGKTTLLKCVAGLERPDSGTVEFTGEDGGAGAGLGSGMKTGIVFQDPRLLPWLTVEGNLRLALPAGDREAGASAIREILALVGLEGWGGAWPRQLSGGMAQRASLARCLCRRPELLLLDEPLSALDSFTRTRLRRELEGIWRRLSLTVILVTHDIEEAVYLGDKVVLMDSGALAAEFAAPLERPRNYRDRAFQDLCAAIEEGTGYDGC